MKTVCFVHNDLDGKCAGAIVKYYNPEAYVIEVSYNRPIPMSKVEDEVIICDFTPSKEDFDELLKRTSGNVTWIDHHQSSIEKFPEYTELKGIRKDTIPSGAMLTWQYYFPQQKPPEFVELVSDYDTWTHKYGSRTWYFVSGARMYKTSSNSQFWIDLIEKEEELKKVLEKGNVVYEYENNENAAYVRQYSFRIKFEGYDTIVCNAARKNSTLFDSLEPDFDIMMIFCVMGDKVRYSLYTSKDIDVSQIALKYGGGGHRKASGFITSYDELVNIIGKDRK